MSEPWDDRSYHDFAALDLLIMAHKIWVDSGMAHGDDKMRLILINSKLRFPQRVMALDRAILSGSELTYFDLGGSTARRLEAGGAKLNHAWIVKSDLTDAYLNNVEGHMMKIESSNLEGVQMAHSSLNCSKILGSVARGARFDRSDMRKCDLSKSDMTRASMVNTNLGGAAMVHTILCGADLRGADLTGANVAGADFTGAIGITESTLAARLGVKFSPGPIPRHEYVDCWRPRV